VVLGISPQLTLEAAMLRAGGIDGLEGGGSVAALTYVKLSGNEPAGLELPIELKRDRTVVSPDEAADDALRKLEELVKAFEDEAMPYRPMVLSMWRNRYGTYDALARIKEWAASAGAIDEI
jgi:ATP-dependent helicase/nuclease subunit B